MALTNFTLPSFGGLATQQWPATISPNQPHHASAVNNLLYGPAGHQESDEPPAGVSHQEYYKNSPYSPPANYQFRTKPTNYLPPHQQQQPSQQAQQHHQLPPQHQQQQQQIGQQIISGGASSYNQPHPDYLAPTPTARTYGEGAYGSHIPTRSPTQRNQPTYFNGYNTPTRGYNQPAQPAVGPTDDTESAGPVNNIPRDHSGLPGSEGNVEDNDGFPVRPPGFTQVQAGRGSRTQVHAVLDYDADETDEADYYEENSENASNGDGHKTNPNVTPIQGPIFLKNGTAPVVPLFAYPTMNNGSFVQIPIWWTALSVALGLDIRGDVIKGVPCIKRYHQLFCPTAGNSYPIDKIERFIDDNKALMRRMYGDFEMIDTPTTKQKRKRHTDEPEFGDGMEFIPDDLEPGESYFAHLRDRQKRQSNSFRPNANVPRITKPLSRPGGKSTSSSSGPNINPNESSTGRMDACESKIEIVTPYWASNSAGKIRAIVNTQHFEQAIHQEICTKSQTSRCGNDCGCEQKYKWHRLLAYDPDNDCKGIFMDWFLFPSCCVCRCAP